MKATKTNAKATKTIKKTAKVNPAKALAIIAKSRKLKTPKTFAMIAKELNAGGLLSPLGRKWTVSNVNRTFNTALKN